jgi:hypothetical protein
LTPSSICHHHPKLKAEQLLQNFVTLNPLKPSGYYMYHLPQTSHNSAFCPRNVFMCSLWFSQ